MNDSPIDFIIKTLTKHLNRPQMLKQAQADFDAGLDAKARARVVAVLDSAPVSYRDGLIIQLAYGICSPTHIDLTKRHEGARSVAGKLGEFLSNHHVRAVADAYQNIAKNSADLVRGNVAAFDDFLRWATKVERKQLGIAFEYVCARVAATARPVTPMPRLDLSALTFSNVSALFSAMFATPSEGAHEQFVIAALLHGLIQQSGHTGYRVETKKLNTSDASSKVAGDIQILTGSRTLEAYEVTANEWGTKLSKAGKTIRDHDLSRLHIVAKVSAEEQDAMLAEIRKLREDVSVIEIRSFASALTAALTRQFRAVALERLYQFLDRYQGVVERVNTYVRLLKDKDLTVKDDG